MKSYSILVALFAVFLMSFGFVTATTYNSTNTIISQCGNITSSGNYLINQSILYITNSSTCINIFSDNVSLNGQNYTLTGNRYNNGIYINNSDNVTIKNITLTNFNSPLKFVNSNYTILDSIIKSTGRRSIYSINSSGIVSSSIFNISKYQEKNSQINVFKQITLNITDANNNNSAIQGATISINGTLNLTTSSNGLNKTTLEIYTNNGTTYYNYYNFNISATGYNNFTLNNISLENKSIITIPLYKISVSKDITFTVKDSNGNPINNAIIKINGGNNTQTTNSSGQATATLEEYTNHSGNTVYDSYNFSVSASNYNSATKNNQSLKAKDSFNFTLSTKSPSGSGGNPGNNGNNNPFTNLAFNGGGGGACVTEWTYSNWSSCVNGIQTRTATYPANFCKPVTKQVTSQLCTVPTIINNTVTNQTENSTPLNATEQNSSGITGAVIGALGGGSVGLGILIFLIALVVLGVASAAAGYGRKRKATSTDSN